MKVRLSDRAEERILEIGQWRREARPDSPTRFRDELVATIEHIAPAPRLRSPFAKRHGKTFWRVLMSITEQHVCSSMHVDADEVIVETVWGARRRSVPWL